MSALAILQEDGAEGPFLAVRRKALQARELLLEILNTDPGRTWRVQELIDLVAERRRDIGHTPIGIALGSLEKEGAVRFDSDFAVHSC